MQKTITVKGSGNLSVKPDLAVLSLSLRTIDKDYGNAMEIEPDDIDLHDTVTFVWEIGG